MLRVSVICQGRLKEPYYIAACREYIKRLGAFCKAEVTELAEDGDVVGRIPRGAYVIALCVEGDKLSRAAATSASSSAGPRACPRRPRRRRICGCPCRT